MIFLQFPEFPNGDNIKGDDAPTISRIQYLIYKIKRQAYSQTI